jgi:hypothetical protein
VFEVLIAAKSQIVSGIAVLLLVFSVTVLDGSQFASLLVTMLVPIVAVAPVELPRLMPSAVMVLIPDAPVSVTVDVPEPVTVTPAMDPDTLMVSLLLPEANTSVVLVPDRVK